MKAFKGFDKDMKCKDFQFEEGKTYEEPTASLCEKGFHACENPLDVLNHYPLLDNDAEPNRFAEVDLEANDERKNDDSKRVGKKIHIKAEFSLKGLIKAGIDFLLETNTAEKDTKEVSSERFSKLAASGYRSKLAASGDDSQLAASGYGSQLAASGYRSQLAASGYRSKLAASGYGSQLAASGDGSQLAASGYRSKLAASGDGSQLAASGYGSQLAASGYRSQLAASGDGSQLAASGYGSQLAASGYGSQLAASGYGSQLAASGENSVVANIGINGIAKAAKGCWITLAEWKHDGEKWVPLAVVTRQVDGEEIKADTWYKLEGDGYELVCAHEAPKDGSA
jgi:hypothetical protein